MDPFSQYQGRIASFANKKTYYSHLLLSKRYDLFEDSLEVYFAAVFVGDKEGIFKHIEHAKQFPLLPTALYFGNKEIIVWVLRNNQKNFSSINDRNDLWKLVNLLGDQDDLIRKLFDQKQDLLSGYNGNVFDFIASKNSSIVLPLMVECRITTWKKFIAWLSQIVMSYNLKSAEEYEIKEKIATSCINEDEALGNISLILKEYEKLSISAKGVNLDSDDDELDDSSELQLNNLDRLRENYSKFGTFLDTKTQSKIKKAIALVVEGKVYEWGFTPPRGTRLVSCEKIGAKIRSIVSQLEVMNDIIQKGYSVNRKVTLSQRIVESYKTIKAHILEYKSLLPNAQAERALVENSETGKEFYFDRIFPNDEDSNEDNSDEEDLFEREKYVFSNRIGIRSTTAKRLIFPQGVKKEALKASRVYPPMQIVRMMSSHGYRLCKYRLTGELDPEGTLYDFDKTTPLFTNDQWELALCKDVRIDQEKYPEEFMVNLYSKCLSRANTPLEIYQATGVAIPFYSDQPLPAEFYETAAQGCFRLINGEHYKVKYGPFLFDIEGVRMKERVYIDSPLGSPLLSFVAASLPINRSLCNSIIELAINEGSFNSLQEEKYALLEKFVESSMISVSTSIRNLHSLWKIHKKNPDSKIIKQIIKHYPLMKNFFSGSK